MKILTTQMGGLFQRIASNGEEAIEETARLLAQATIGEGRVILAGFGEMEAVIATALDGVEPFHGAVRYEKEMEIGSADRVWLLTRSASDEQALKWRDCWQIVSSRLLHSQLKSPAMTMHSKTWPIRM